MIVIKIVDVTIAGVLYFGFANMYVISPKKTTAKAVWPEGKEYPVSWIRVEIGRSTWKMTFRILIVAPVNMDVVARRIAERLRARLSVVGCRLLG